MKHKHVAKIEPGALKFVHKGIEYDVTNVGRKDMKIWTLHKKFGRSTEYRALIDLAFATPVAIQRLRCIKKEKDVA